MNRRRLIQATGLASLAAIGAGKLVLSANAKPTPQSGDLGAYGEFLKSNPQIVTAAQAAPQAATLPQPFAVTPQEIEGPFFRSGAPTRYAITQPHEPGTVMVITGRVWAFDTKQPLANTELHIWHSDDAGRYDNDDDNNPPAANVFVNRGVIFTDTNGAYEYQTIHPGRYMNGNQYRPSHIHYHAIKPGYRKLTTQLYFKGDPYIAVDPWAKRTPTLVIDLTTQTRYGKSYESGNFDIVLKP